MNGVLALSRAQWLLLVRSRTAAAMALLFPLLLGGFMAFGTAPEWNLALTLQLLAAQGVTVYVGVTSAFAARRQDLTLKRLRSGELPDAAIIVGVLAPFVALGLVQSGLMVVLAQVAGAPLPDRPFALLLAIVGGVAVSAAAGLLTTAFTGSAEAAQITTAPFFFATLAGGIWVFTTDPAAVERWQLFAPGAAVADLVRGSTQPLWWPVLALLAWAVAGWVLGIRNLRWDPRG
ncbi:ABC transporter permease [Actinokineospora sp. NBRC 105648]|uniref:ABC transporter permease n=1 Tax=Actinokineospora sp. NBRC 105648 TaxID=3032206 RepID=UPI0024A4469B|nr:ABC transporter permease [Actinokineospora sp. NBRC 105648]GLZ40265.1 transport permease protein [Actinokineospora sp. NBRC 105648]